MPRGLQAAAGAPAGYCSARKANARQPGLSGGLPRALAPLAAAGATGARAMHVAACPAAFAYP
ncbi:hypothetical protein CFB89_20725 [Burkholderia sp. AU16741]|nr:hypothetical protein CFB89_20725 [Burkholderia sp. AU16741]